MVKACGRGFETALSSVFYYRKEAVAGRAVSSLGSATPVGGVGDVASAEVPDRTAS